MKRMCHRFMVIALWSFGAWCIPDVSAVENPGQRLIREATAVLRINDPQWLDREVSRFSAALGIDPSPLRGVLARGIFHSRSLDGLDVTRPALLAWRSGPAPLIGIFPITNRRLFLSQFGVGLADEVPLIRTGERDGTIIYTQNGNEGTQEYRVMIGDNDVVCLARTVAECRALLGVVLPHTGSEAPLVFTDRGTWVGAQHTPIKSDSLTAMSASLSEKNISPFLQQWDSFSANICETSMALSPDASDGMKVEFQVKAVPDSLLGVWIGNQRNQPNRLLPLIRTPNTVAWCAGQIAWQGQGGSCSAAIGGLIKSQLGSRWTDQIDEAWSALGTVCDRNGAFATVLDLQLSEKGLGGEWKSLVEQRRAAEVVAHMNTIESALGGTPGDTLSVAGVQGYRWTASQGAAVGAAATDRYLAMVASTLRSADLAMVDLVQKSQGSAVPDATSGIMMMSIDAAPAARSLAASLGKVSDIPLKAAIITGVLRTTGKAEVSVDVVVPHMRLAGIVRDSGLLVEEPVVTTKKR